jgi:hypothetical protein
MRLAIDSRVNALDRPLEDNMLKKLMASLLITMLFVLPACPVSQPQQDMQRLARHWIIMYDQQNDEAAGCTAQAVSDHTLLTAEHCIVPGGQLYVDLVPHSKDDFAKNKPTPITNIVLDGQDHALLTTPNMTYQYKIHYSPATSVAPVLGEHVYWYGNPAGVQNIARDGKIVGTIPAAEIADGKNATLFVVQAPVVGGDSGSAVYDDQGNLIGVITYGILGDGGVAPFMGFYPLAFTPAQVALAEGRYLLLPMAQRGRVGGGRPEGPRGGERPRVGPRGGERHGGRPHDRIPDREWHSHFGHEHPFMLHWEGPYLFTNGGYAFIILEPVPDFWLGGPVFVDFVDYPDGYVGYVLCSPAYPGVFVRIAIQ